MSVKREKMGEKIKWGRKGERERERTKIWNSKYELNERERKISSL